MLTSELTLTRSNVDCSQGEVMPVRNGFVLFVALCALTFLVACGGNGTTITNPQAPPTGAFSQSNLNGTYVFSVSGTDEAGAPFAMVGTFTANGSGGITSGTLDLNDLEFSGTVPNSPISSSSTYGVSVDGRGTAKLGTNTPFGTITLDFVLQDSSHGFVTEFDANASGSGTLDLQTAGSSPVGTYAFGFSGDSGSSLFATVGNFALGAGGAITGTEDFNVGGISNNTDQGLSGTVVLGPSSTPATLLTTTNIAVTYDVFAINANHLKFIEMDTSGTLSGDAFSQTTATIPAGTMAFSLQGGISTPVAAGGFMVSDGAGNITNASSEDVNSGGTVPATANFSAQYTAAGTGRFTLGTFSNFIGGTDYAAYPSSGGLLLLEIDSGGLMFGAAYPQSSTTFATGQGYALNLAGTNIAVAAQTGSAEEVDDIAEFAAQSAGTTVTGLVDENYAPSGGPIFDQALTGTYSAPDTNGRGQVAATAGNSTNSTLNGGFGITFYTVDGTTFPFIETDNGGQIASGVFVLQNPTAGATPGIARAHNMFVPPPLSRQHAARQKAK